MALKAKIAASVASAQVQSILSSATPTTGLTYQEQVVQRQQNIEERERSLNLIIDSEGRTIDKRTGEVVQLQSRMPTLKANLKSQKRDYRTALGGDKTDLFASGIASTISGVSSVYQGIKSILSTGPSVEAEAQDKAVSEAFFDPRLK